MFSWEIREILKVLAQDELLTAAMADSSSLDIPLPVQKTSSSLPSVPSSQMRSLTLTDLVPVPDEDKAEATRIKAQANQAFGSMYKSHSLARLDPETRGFRS